MLSISTSTHFRLYRPAPFYITAILSRDGIAVWKRRACRLLHLRGAENAVMRLGMLMVVTAW